MPPPRPLCALPGPEAMRAGLHGRFGFRRVPPFGFGGPGFVLLTKATAAWQWISPAPAQDGASGSASHDLRMRSATLFGLSEGSALNSNAARPATCGQAPLVPHH